MAKAKAETGMRLLAVAVAMVWLSGCAAPGRDLRQAHYGLTKQEILARLGKPGGDERYAIQNQAMIESAARQSDLANTPEARFRSVKIGDRIEECQWIVGGEVLLVKFVNDEIMPALVWIVESDI